MTPADPTRTHDPQAADGHTGTFDPALDAGLAAAFGPDPTPGGWSQPPLLRDDPSENAPLVQPSSPEMPRGQSDRYQLLGEIARGGMGVILKGRDPDLGRDLAFKVLKAELAGKPAAVQRFVEEAQVGGQLQHPGVVPVYDLGRFADGRPYFAMKLVKGRTLAEMLTERATPSADRGQFLQIFLQVCQPIAYAHSKGVIHRDLKPSNVMVGAFGEVLVMDWGLAKVLPLGGLADEERASPLASGARKPSIPEEPTAIHTARSGSGSDTLAGSVMGTPAFMGPEQAGGEIEKLDERADVFGLGAVLCVILTGQPPYVGDSADAVRLMAVRGQLADAFARLDACGADDELTALCKRCLAADRDARPRSAGAVAADLGAYLAGVEDRARRAELDRAAAEVRTGEERKRRRVQLALAAAVGLLLLGGGAFGWSQDRAAELAKRRQAEFDAEQARAAGERKVEQAKAEAAEGRAAAGVGAALALAADLRAKYQFAEAGAALDQAAGLVPPGGPAELRAALRRAADDLAFVRELDEVRMLRSVWIEEESGRGHFDSASTAPAYRSAFLARGLDVGGGNPEAVARQIRTSAVKAELVAALDDWAVLERDRGVQVRVLAVARAADPGPWTDRFRDPAVRADKGALERLAREADPAALSPGTVVALAAQMRRTGLHPVPVLLAAQIAHPGDFLIPFTLGGWFLSKRDPEAVAYFRAARVTRPDNYAVVTNLGTALGRKGEWDGAVACFREAVRLAPKSAKAHKNLGATLAQKGDLDGAIASSREAIRLDPNFAAAYFNIGVVLHRRGDVEAATASYREAIRIDPRFAPAHDNLGVTLAGKGDYDGAVARHKEAIRIAPDYAGSHYHLGLALVGKGDYAGAAACFRAAVRLDPKFTKAHTNLGHALQRIGDLDGAIACHREAIRLDPKLARAHDNLGVALAKKGDSDGAIACHREAIRLDPKDANTRNNLGNLLLRKGDLDGAADCYREAIRLDPEDARFPYNLGKVLSRTGDFDGAAASYRAAIRLDPKLALAHYNLGLLMSTRGDVDGAIASYKEAIRLDPGDANAPYNLGVALTKKGDVDGAIATYKVAIRLNPKLAQARNNLGGALKAGGERDAKREVAPPPREVKR